MLRTGDLIHKEKSTLIFKKKFWKNQITKTHKTFITKYINFAIGPFK